MLTTESRSHLTETLQRGTLSYVHTRVTSEQRTRPLQRDNRERKRKSLSRSQRASERIRTNAKLVSLLEAVGEREKAHSVARCHSRLAAITCGVHVSRLIPNHTCESRLCSFCARRRSAKLVHKYGGAVRAYAAKSGTTPMLLTLTLKHRPEKLRESVKRLQAHFKALRRRGFWKEYFAGGLFSIEFTIDADGNYHTHLHALVFRTKFCDVQKLKDLWLEITGDSHVVNLQRIGGDVMDGLREVMKYAVKPACINDFTPAHVVDFMAMRGQKMFGTFGGFQKFFQSYTPDDADGGGDFFCDDSGGAVGEPCGQCGEILYEVRMNLNDLPAFLRRCESESDRGSPEGKQSKVGSNRERGKVEIC